MVLPYGKPTVGRDSYRVGVGVGGFIGSSMAVDSLPPAPGSGDTGASVAGVCNSNLLLDDPSKKIRKPYTITKSRKNWTDIEHEKFLEGLHLFDRDWKKIEAFVGSKTAIQIRSHAQKYFLKVQKSGTNEHVPPPRPKRKAAHPYPHKAPKNGVSNVGVLRPSTDLLEVGDFIITDSCLWPTNPGSNRVLSSCMYNTVPPVTGSVLSQDDVRSSCAAISYNCCSSSIDSGPGLWPTGEMNNQQKVKQSTTRRVLPDFAKVYRFIGSVFDPDASNHLQKLKMMDPVDVEAVVLLMKNLCANLKSPQFDQYRKIISSYDADPEGTKSNNSFVNLQALSMPPGVVSSS